MTIRTGSEGVTLIDGFTVLQGVPTVRSIDPNAGQRGLTRDVSITGAFTNWQSGTTSVSYGPDITVNSNVVTSATTITTNITIDANAALGPRDVIITTGNDVLTVPLVSWSPMSTRPLHSSSLSAPCTWLSECR